MLRRLWFLITRNRRQLELDEEMRLHVELRAAANRDRGLSAADAARGARLRFGNRLKLREESVDVWRLAPLEDTGRDLRHALRRLTGHPGRALVLVLTLAIGIGATTAMFSLIDALLVKSAPWDGSGRLALLVGLDAGSLSPRWIPYADYLVYRDRTTTLAGLAAESGSAMAVGTPSPQRVLGAMVSGNYFDVLGIHAALGRALTADDDQLAHPAVVLSYTLWTEQFGGLADAVGREVTINGQPFTVVGVAPRGFTGVIFAGNPTQLWIPLSTQHLVMPPASDASQPWPPVQVVGRLADGVAVAAADAEVRVIARSLDAARTPTDRGPRAGVVALRGGLTPWEQASLAPTVRLIAVVPLFVLLVACANAANVLIAQHQSRQREFAMRRAIGASRARLVRQLLIESGVLALGAAITGIGAARLLIAVIVSLGEIPVDFSTVIEIKLRALAAATATAVAAIAVFGLAPALTATRFDVLPILKNEGTTSTAAPGPRRLRRSLLVAQIALSLTLLIVAGLFLQSLRRTLRVDPGFDPRGLATVSLDTSLLHYTRDQRAALTARYLEQLSRVPGVTSAAAADVLPLGGVRYGATLRADSAASAKASVAQVSPSYFETLGLAMLSGRTFTPGEIAANAPVAVVSASAAERLWPGESPLGQSLRTDDPKQPARQVIGIVRDSTWLFLDEIPSSELYLPLPPASAGAFVVRSSRSARETLAALKEIARVLDPNVPVTSAQTMEERVRRSVNLRRAMVSVLGVLGAITLLLASVGIYGVAAHSASMRTREIGIRMAIGARTADVLRLVMYEQMWQSLAGVAIGGALSVAAVLVLSSFLFGLTRRDATVFVGAAVALVSVTAVASYLPARSAARLDPLRALRHDG